jgi:hypothetical protein
MGLVETQVELRIQLALVIYLHSADAVQKISQW